MGEKISYISFFFLRFSISVPFSVTVREGYDFSSVCVLSLSRARTILQADISGHKVNTRRGSWLTHIGISFLHYRSGGIFRFHPLTAILPDFPTLADLCVCSSMAIM